MWKQNALTTTHVCHTMPCHAFLTCFLQIHLLAQIVMDATSNECNMNPNLVNNNIDNNIRASNLHAST